MCANLAYYTLCRQGFDKEALYYLTDAVEVDMDANGAFDEVAGPPTRQAMIDGLTGWATDATNLLIYMVGPGAPGMFRLNEDEWLTAPELAQVVDQLQSVIPGAVIVVYDASHSASFLPELEPAGDKLRHFMASAGNGQPAYFAMQGMVSFSYLFWTAVFNGRQLAQAFDNALHIIGDIAGYQTPQVSSNVVQLSKDGEISELSNLDITDGTTQYDDLAALGDVSPRQVLEGDDTAAQFSAEGVAQGRARIARVWAVITRHDLPEGNKQSSDDTVTDVVTCEFDPGDEDTFEGSYDEFDEPGEYQVDVYAMDASLNICEPQQTWVTKSGLVPGMIIGTVTDAVTEAPIAAAQVTISGLGMQTTTNDSGAYAFSGLPSDNYTVQVAADGYLSQTRTANVQEGEQTTLVFFMEPEGGEGEGEGENGSPGCFGGVAGGLPSRGHGEAPAGDIILCGSLFLVLIGAAHRGRTKCFKV